MRGSADRRALEVAPEHLRRQIDPASLPFESTREVQPVSREALWRS